MDRGLGRPLRGDAVVSALIMESLRKSDDHDQHALLGGGGDGCVMVMGVSVQGCSSPLQRTGIRGRESARFVESRRSLGTEYSEGSDVSSRLLMSKGPAHALSSRGGLNWRPGCAASGVLATC